MKKRDRITGDLQESSEEDKREKIETLNNDLGSVDERVTDLKNQAKGG